MKSIFWQNLLSLEIFFFNLNSEVSLKFLFVIFIIGIFLKERDRE